MMDPISVQEMTAFLPMFMALLEKIGAEGVLGFILGGPLLVISAFWLQSWGDRRHNIRIIEDYRKSFGDLWEKHREDTLRMQEEHRQETLRMREDHRQETAAVIRKFDESLEKTTRYYENNVLLVQNYEKVTGELQNLIVTTIQTLSRVDAHFEGLFKSYRPKAMP